MPAHIHAELMIQYGQDALTTDKPWELWECQPPGFIAWMQLYNNPSWNTTTKYRRKQKTININGFEVPEPVREPLLKETYYCVTNILVIPGSTQYKWSGDSMDYRFLERGLIHLTQEDAELHAKALLSFTKIDK